MKKLRIHRAARQRRSFVAAIAAITLGMLLAAAPTGAHAGPQARLATGPYAVLHAVLKKSFLKLEVARVKIRVDEGTQRKLAELAAGRRQSRALEDGVVHAVMGTKRALITSELMRDVPFDKYAASVYHDARSARDSGLIGDATYWSLARLLPDWLRVLRDRGAHRGDQFMCRIQPGALQLAYRSGNGLVLLERAVANPDLGLAVLGSYLAPQSATRGELLDSVFR